MMKIIYTQTSAWRLYTRRASLDAVLIFTSPSGRRSPPSRPFSSSLLFNGKQHLHIGERELGLCNVWVVQRETHKSMERERERGGFVFVQTNLGYFCEVFCLRVDVGKVDGEKETQEGRSREEERMRDIHYYTGCPFRSQESLLAGRVPFMEHLK